MNSYGAKRRHDLTSFRHPTLTIGGCSSLRILNQGIPAWARSAFGAEVAKIPVKLRRLFTIRCRCRARGRRGFQRLFRRFELEPASFGRWLRRQDGSGRSWRSGWGAPHEQTEQNCGCRREFPRACFGPFNAIGEDLAKVFDIKRRLTATTRLDISKRHWILVRFGASDRDGKFDNTPSGMG
jgi:hypothetical protein